MLTKSINIIRVDEGLAERQDDILVTEVSVQINLNGTEIAMILASPYKEKELGVGFLYTEGFINNVSEIRDFKQDGMSLYFSIDQERFDKENKIQKFITSGCGRGSSFAIIRKSLLGKKREIIPLISSRQIFELMRVFQKRSELFQKTGGVHSAALCNTSECLFFAEDIGRHNAVDRVIGEALLNNISLNDKVLLTSGRVSSEIARKVAQSEIPVLVSRSAPTDRALTFAQELQLTIVGFARVNKFNIYTHEERIL